MSDKTHEQLSRRERQIMDAIYSRQNASVAEVIAAIADPPGYSAVRAMLRILEQKGHLKHTKIGPRYIYRPTRSPAAAARSAVKRLTETFFGGSAAAVMVNLLESDELDQAEIKRIRQLLDRRTGRPSK